MRKNLIFAIGILMLLSLAFVSAQTSGESNEVAGTGDSTVCCEKTKSGLFCQDVKAADCASDRQPPTACSSTSFCKTGWCYDSTEGTCLDNVPQLVCTDNGGTWSNTKPPVCNLGCCILDDQASFVSLVRCKKLSGFYGLETNWDSSITSEPICILSAGTQEKGACVYEKDFEKTCKFTTKGACTTDNIFNGGVSSEGGSGTNRNPAIDVSNSGLTPATNAQPALTTPTNQQTGGTQNTQATQTGSSGTATTTAILPFVSAQTSNQSGNGSRQQTADKKVTFFPGKLCSAEELETNCAPTRTTICVPGKEEVYFVDSCGNPANIYDAAKVNSRDYWNNIVEKDKSCGGIGNNKESQSCGNCNYLLGSYCREAEKVKPTYGDFICANLNCNDNGKQRINGESWCVTDSGKDKPGSRYYREICSNGEIKTEACADYRQEECIESNSGGYSQAACRVNRWQDCTAQKKKEDCTNADKRDCKWLDGIENMLFGGALYGNNGTASGTGASSAGGDPLAGIAQAAKAAGGLKNLPKGACVPQVPPGFNFETNEGAAICAQANAACPVTYEKGLIGGDWKCKEHCECLPGGELEKKRVALCNALGDCGPKTNFIGVQGSGKGYEVKTQKAGDDKK